ncbi:hypothetical protein OUZ56_003004 [Daphnia magna]|uniref:ADAMTS/ADAMTS-like Spacer 1 domain-containing protein n=1 Tax=Daphnia magna TaxID=35525 RepID=A0ABR0A7I0_9CRUS|nr:hypothetical protein OUZ56_003004 [Daphnia magna]
MNILAFHTTTSQTLTIGCDGIVGSEKRPDACGVCGGSNSTCQIVSGIFTEPQLPPGYNLVAQLPKGACHVNITEFKPSRNYLGKSAIIV